MDIINYLQAYSEELENLPEKDFAFESKKAGLLNSVDTLIENIILFEEYKKKL